MPIDRWEIENFLYREARLLDEGKLQDWLKLFTEEARYWIPCNRDDIDPMREVSIIYDDRDAVATLTDPSGPGPAIGIDRGAFRQDPGVGGLFAEKAPTEPASTLQNYPFLPPDLKPPYAATNQALFGYDFDRDTSPPGLSSLHVNAGQIAPELPAPANWVDGGITPVANLADTFSQQPVNAVDWFFPTRITIDANGADQMRMNPVAKYLGLRLKHTSKVNLPFYVVQTDDTGGDVLKGARNWIRRTKTPKSQTVMINADPQMSHLDPLMASPKKNVFLKTVGPFLKKAFATRGNRRR